jgi:deazaflavin-dependent oxidoreductase (nitroreductase family)
MTIARRSLPSHHSPPSGLLRLLLKAPIPFYRAGFGWLFGHHLLMLEHRGRRSGGIHRTAVEVVRYDSRTRESIVAAGWGTDTQWYRNIQVTPASEVRTGNQRFAPAQRFLGEEEARELLDAYVSDHRFIARFILRWLGYDWSNEGRERFYQAVRLVGFRPR